MAAKTKFCLFIGAMSEESLESYAKSCKTTPAYLSNQLMYGNKVPRRDFMALLVLNSGGKVSRQDVLDHFYPEDLFEAA